VIVNTQNGVTGRIDTLNDDILAGVEMGTYESVTYSGAEGRDIQMWVHYPPGFDASRKYPLFLLIHGGPHSAITDGFHFRWNAQTFASWGYVTAWHNFHGSSGFGQEFTDAINPDWITRPYEDTRKAAEWFAEKPWIDETRMVAGGGSYGGYLSSILLGREHTFKALVIHAPVYNLYSQLASDFAVHSTRFGHYWEDPALYGRLSPHYYAGNFETPALIIHGQLDYRVPVGQSFELFRTLQSRGVDSRLIYYPDENHWILKPNNSIYWYSQVRMDRRVRRTGWQITWGICKADKTYPQPHLGKPLSLDPNCIEDGGQGHPHVGKHRFPHACKAHPPSVRNKAFTIKTK
jgi:dipeptidyl aminopeptidase/acylaminoacyl peptidase